VQRCFLLQEKHGVLEKIKQEPQKGEVTQDHFTFLSQVKKLVQHSNNIFAICNSTLLPSH